MSRKRTNFFLLLLLFSTFYISSTYGENIKENFSFTQTGSIQNINMGSGEILHDFTASGNILTENLVDENVKYYSGFFQYEGNTYGNSYYDESFHFPENILEENNIEIIEKEDFENVLIFEENNSKSVNLKNTFENSQIQMSILSSPNTLRDGLVGEWLLDGNALDTSGNENHGTPYNVTWVDSGEGDGKRVASFNGGSYIYINNSPLLEIKNNITIHTTVKLLDITGLSDNNIILNKEGIPYEIAIHDNSVIGCEQNRDGIARYNFSWHLGGVNGYPNHQCGWVDGGGPIIRGNTTMLSLTYNGINVKAYINGILTKVYPANGQIFSNTNPLLIGARIGTGSPVGFFLGEISNVKIYNRALSDTEIQQLYQEGITNNSTSTNTPTYTYNPLFLNQNKIYNIFDKSTNACYVNESLKQTNTATSQADLGNKGDPVNLATGEFDYENTFLNIPGEKIPYEFSLNYKNQTYYNGPVGINWDHNYNKYIVEEENGNILYYNGKLGVFRFLKNNSNTYEYNLGVKANLVHSGGIFGIHYDSGKKEYFNLNNRLSQIQDIYENEINFSYDTNNLLSQVTDTLGRNIDYTYENNRLIKVKDFLNNSVEIMYYTGNTNSGSLYDIKEITINNNEKTKTIAFEYDANHNMKSLIDAKGAPYVKNTYDTNKRVATQIYGTGTIVYNYTLSGSQVTKNTVTDKVGNITEYVYDNYGNNIQTIYRTNPENIIYNYAYDASGYLISETKPLGNGIKYIYDNRGNIIEKRQKENMSASDSNSDIFTTYTYNSKNQILTQTLPNGVVIENTYNTNGNLVSKETSNIKNSALVPYSVLNTFAYDALGQLVESTDAKGNKTYFHYSSGMLLETQNGTGSNAISNQFTYNDYGILTSKTDGRGNTITFEINDFNQTGTGITSEGIVKSFLYDENNNILKESHYFTGGVKQIQNFYDILDNPVQINSDYDTGKEVITHIKYDNNGNIIEKQTGSGAVIKYTYDNFSKLIHEKIIIDENDDSYFLFTGYGYDKNGNLMIKLYDGANIDHYQYDLFDRLIKKLSVDGSYTKFYYNKDNSLEKEEKYSSGNILLSKKEFVYNGIGKVLLEKYYKDPINNSGSVIITYDYDLNRNLISQIDTLGNTTTFQYDNFNRLIKTIDSLENEITNTYDKNNNIISKTILQNNGKITTTNYVYDKDNRLISETNQLGKIKTYTYNQLGQITNTTDEKGNITQYTYDYTGHILSKTSLSSSGNIVIIYTYDERGNNTSVTDGEGNITTYVYNNINQLIQTKYPDNKEINYIYDRAGNIVSTTDPNGTIINNTYDMLGRIISRNINTGSGVEGVNSETYSYDSLGRLVSATDSNNHSLEFTYDSLNRLISESQSGSLVSYTYDDGNNLLSITNPNGKTTDYTYDGLNRVLGISFSGTTFANYTYSGVLNDSLAYGNGKNISKTYDDLNRILNFNNGVKNYSYSYDDVSNIISDSFKNYTFDNFYRLSQVSESASGTLLENFELDKAGNRVFDIGNNEYEVNILNQYTSLSGSLNHSFVYDNNGNLISDGEKTFVYDYKNRLLKVQDNSGMIAEFAYDVLGRRYEKKTNSQTISYIYSDKNIISEYITVGENSFRKEYVNGIGLDDVIAVVQEESDISFEEIGELNFCNARVLTYSSSFIQYGWNSIIERCESLVGSGSEVVAHTYYFHKNHLGSIVGITDISGNVVSEYEYDSYGNFSLSGSDIGNTRLFTGREFDFEIGLYYNRARYYSSELGRFISRDPIGQVDDVNLYAYVANNPVMFNDLNGKAKDAIIKIFREAGEDMRIFREKSEWDWWSNDLDPDLNLHFFSREVARIRGDGKYDLAYLGDGEKGNKLTTSIKGIFDCKGLEKNCTGYVEFDQEQLNLGEISNVLAGLNSYRLGFSQSHLEYWAMVTVKLGLGNGVEGELADRKLYDYGYKLGELEKINGLLTDNDIINHIKDATYARQNYLNNK